MDDRPRWLDLIYGVIMAGLLVAGVFLFVENRELRQDNRDRKAQFETLVRWHIHVSARLDEEPVIGGQKESQDEQRTVESE